MFERKKILAVIAARGGSKEVPRKNLRKLADKPLLVWTIEEAGKSSYLDKVILSSEDDEIINIARKSGCDVPFIRPKILSRDNTTAVEVALHAIEELNESYDFVVMLQPTSPLRTASDIDGCIELCIKSSSPSCVTVTKNVKHPLWSYSMNSAGILQQFIQADLGKVQRQELPEVFVLNGAVYITRIEWFKKVQAFVTKETMGYIMPEERSLDIDTEFDILIADFLLKRMVRERHE